MALVVVPYDPSWPDSFQKLKSTIWPAVKDLAIGIEHVGSTSVPGLAAKPVIDIDVVVATETMSTRAVQALTSLGYVHRGNLGLEGREAMESPEGGPAHHLYVCTVDSEAYQNYILVRDFLRANPEVAKDYGELKLSLAKTFHNDIEGYIDGKTDLLLHILRESGFGREALERAEVANRKPTDR